MAGFPIFKFSGSRLTRKFSEIIATYLNPDDMQQIKDTYNEKYAKQFEELNSVLDPFVKPPPETIFKKVDRGELLILALPAINKHLKKLLLKIRVLFDKCSEKCTAMPSDEATQTQLDKLQKENAYAYAQVCKTKRVKKCIQFMTLVGLFETKLAKVNKLVDSVLNNRATRGTPSSRDNIRKSISPNISISEASKEIEKGHIFVISPNISRTANTRRRRISPDSSDEIRKFQQQYAKFLEMISRKMKGGKTRRLSKKIWTFDNTYKLYKQVKPTF